LVAALATALMALALSPLRVGLQRVVDRRLYPCGRQLCRRSTTCSTASTSARPEQLAERLRVTLRDPDLRVGYLSPDGEGMADESGAALDRDSWVPVVTGGTTIGVLQPSSRSLRRAAQPRGRRVRDARRTGAGCGWI
jgi:hypothetical protein